MIESKFFQFPIGCLHIDKPLTAATAEDKSQVLHRVFDHAVQRAGRSKIETMKMNEVISLCDRVIARYRQENNHGYEWFNRSNRQHQERLVGESMLGWNSPGKPSIDKNKLAYGMSKLTRVSSELYADALKNPAFTLRTFAVLCAVKSGIGGKIYARLSRNQIRAMAAGFAGANEYKQRSESESADIRLTDNQVRTDIAHLVDRGFFVRFCPNRRHTFYSGKLSLDELVDVLARKFGKLAAKHQQAAQSHQLFQKRMNRYLEQDATRNGKKPQSPL